MYGPRPAARLCNEKMALVWSRTAMVPSGWAESRPFPRLFEHRVRSLFACERLRTIAVVFYLSFLPFSVVVVGFSCFQTWEMVGQVKKMDLGGCKLLSPVVHVALDTLLGKAPSLVDNCTFRDGIDENVAGGSSCFRTPFVHGQLRCSCNSWVVDLHCSDASR